MTVRAKLKDLAPGTVFNVEPRCPRYGRLGE